MEKNNIENKKILTGWVEGKISDKEKFESFGIKLGKFYPYEDNPNEGHYEDCIIEENNFLKLKNVELVNSFDFKTSQDWAALAKHRKRK